jgi:DNA helicase-2/ATP-dependent DNA helicase PcrA
MRKTTPAFVDNYKRLNDGQRQAVDTIEGPVLVVAGPGTGKTQILTLRIANILLTTDTPPDAVLALTFTEAGVDAMKRRLLQLIGPTAYRVPIHTFHGFCNTLIHAHPEYFPRIVSATALTDIESIVLIREALSELPLEKLKPFGDPFYYVQTVRGAISTLKREHKTPDDVRIATGRRMQELQNDPESYHTKGAHKGKMKGFVQTAIERLAKEEELGRVFAWYEAKLAEKKKFDYEDMIGEVVRALGENEEFRMLVQESYLYLLADEHQDANGAQNTLLELLSAYDPSPNLFIVGDEKQAIFRFQGASLDSFSFFKSKYPDAAIIRLEESYRSGAPILDAAHSLMEGSIPEDRHPRLLSRVSEPLQAAVEVREFSTEDRELSWIVSDIAEKIADGVSLGDMAVIFRTNADAAPMARLLAQRGILYVVDSKSNVFDIHAIAQLVTYLRLCTTIGNSEYLAHVLHFPWIQLSSHDVYRILLYAQKRRLPPIEVLSSPVHAKSAGVVDSDAALACGKTLEKLSTLAREVAARDFFDAVLHESGFLAYVLKRNDAVTILNAVRGLANTIEVLSSSQTLYSGADFVRDLGLYEEYGIDIEPDTQPKERTNALHLITAHRSKGLEYEHVYIIHARDTHWGNRAERNKLPLSTLAATLPDSDLDDERRLFYVALTRAKRSVSISYGVSSQKRERESGVTQFVLEMRPELVHRFDMTEFESSIKPEDAFLPLLESPDTLSDMTFLQDAFLEQGLSATALNNYLSCPWKYFYRNLVRVPEKPTPSSLYGNALHNALRLFRDIASSTRVYPELPVLLQYLNDSIDAQGFSPMSYEDARTKGIRALSDWYERHREGFSFDAVCERKFEVYQPLSSGALGQVLLRGMIDVIEFRPDGSLRVVDYKTGKHKSRNELEGNTKKASGDYKRQLDFYCILLELSRMERPKELSLEFIEPDERGKTTEHVFPYDEDAVSLLKETIEKAAQDIYSLGFWNRRCDDPSCEYCALRANVA